ncbi:MAG: chemotaxis protein CheW [Treponema sp.]|nr:chemotaxis protein CheW [Treponema sp.]
MANQYLTFTLNGSYYAFEVYCVQEVLTYTQPVKVPCAVSYIEGLINSRNKEITVINLRSKFQMPALDPTKDTRIIVVETKTPTEEDPDHISVFGVVADFVHEVIELNKDDLEPPPKFGNAISPEFIIGLGKKNDTFILVIDPDKIFSSLPSDTWQQGDRKTQ